MHDRYIVLNVIVFNGNLLDFIMLFILLLYGFLSFFCRKLDVSYFGYFYYMYILIFYQNKSIVSITSWKRIFNKERRKMKRMFNKEERKMKRMFNKEGRKMARMERRRGW